MLQTCKALGGWTTEFGDNLYKTHDIHFEDKLPDFYSVICNHFHEKIVPECCNYWEIGDFTVRSAFAIKYSIDTQRTLKIHHDDSYISGSIKLNSDYQGAELFFPRQGFDNTEIDVGDIILWPGDITHRHGCSVLESGEKYSLTLWTKKNEKS